MVDIQNEQINEKYEVLKLINRGGSSRVYLALDRNLNRQWAIKKIKKKKNSSHTNSLMAEAEIMKHLDHNALPRIVDIIDDNDYFYIIMDYVQGENLKTVLRADGPQDQETVVEWGIELCDVLQYLHDHNIIYRDMKPANVMLTIPDGNIKVIDFGIAREYKSYAKEDTQSLGTEGYAAPEQYEGRGQTDARTDIYGLGVTLFQLLTDINPAGYKEPLDIRKYDSTLSTGLSKIILKCTEKDPDDRFQTANELKHALINYRKYDEEYIAKKKKTVKQFYMLLIISGVFAAIALASFAGSFFQKNSRYDALISGSPSAENIQKAISLKPGEEAGYNALLESYGDIIEREEVASFSEIYGNGKDSMSKKTLLDVSMNAGEKILMSYEEPQERSKLLTAYPYFYEVAHGGDASFDRFDAAVLYCNMAEFYQKYIMQEDSLVVKEASREEYENILDQINQNIDTLDEYEGNENNTLKLSSYKIMLSLLYEEADTMQNKGISKNSIDKIINKIEKETNQINSSVSSVTAKKQEVQSSILDTKNKVNDAYSEKKEEKEGR